MASTSSFNSTESKCKEKMEIYKELKNLFGCVNCTFIPRSNNLYLGSCLHHYCESCIERFKGKKCIAPSCKSHLKADDVRIDEFAKNYLVELRKTCNNEKLIFGEDKENQSQSKINETFSNLKHGSAIFDDDYSNILTEAVDIIEQNMTTQESSNESESLKNPKKSSSTTSSNPPASSVFFGKPKYSKKSYPSRKSKSNDKEDTEKIMEPPEPEAPAPGKKRSISTSISNEEKDAKTTSTLSNNIDDGQSVQVEEIKGRKMRKTAEEKLVESDIKENNNEAGPSRARPSRATVTSKVIPKKPERSSRKTRNSTATEEKVDESINNNRKRETSKEQAKDSRSSSTSSIAAVATEMPEKVAENEGKGRKLRKSLPKEKVPLLINPSTRKSPSPFNLESPKNLKGKRDINHKRPTSPALSISSISSKSSTKSPSASIEKKNPKGETRLHIACRAGQIEKVKSLIDAGADVNVKDYAGWLPIQEAINSNIVKRGDIETGINIIELLIKGGCDVDIPGYEEGTALHMAASLGLEKIVKLLMEKKACPNIRNKYGKLPKDLANQKIVQMIEDYETEVSQRSADSVVLKIQLEKALLFFVCEKGTKNSEVVEACKTVLKAKISKDFRREVTHIIFPFSKNVEESVIREYSDSLDFLSGILNGCWILYSDWITDSLAQSTFLDPSDYEIQLTEDFKENLDNPNPNITNEIVTKRARINKEIGNPSLFSGLDIYLYKECSAGNLKKKDLVKLITVGDGKIIKQLPNPDLIDPLENPVRFHAQNAKNKLAFTSHLILYDKNSEPGTKLNMVPKVRMEHVKSLQIEWLIDSIKKFVLLDPDLYY